MDDMTIVLLCSVGGRFGGNIGDLKTLPLPLARAWIEAGVAMPLPDEAPEAAVLSAPERAVRPRARGRG